MSKTQQKRKYKYVQQATVVYETKMKLRQWHKVCKKPEL